MKPLARDDTEARQWISDLVDGHTGGEGDAGALERACAAWQGDAELRRTWHAYHLIGDVLRSDELAGPPSRDAALVAALRRRLAQEPVVLAPAALPRQRRQRPRHRQVWLLPVAAAAGFVAVAGVLVLLQQAGAPDPTGLSGPMLAVRAPATGVVPVASVVAEPGQNAQLLRDARIDDYLRAHRETLAGSPAALPGGAMRSVDFIVTPR